MRVLIASLALVFVPYLLSRLTSSFRAVQVFSAATDSAATEQPEAIELPESLRIVCFNMAHGRGLASSNWEGGDRTTCRGRLAEISELLDELDVDIVVLNEVDFDASWSGNVNQAELLTFPAERPNRVIDWVLIPRAWQFACYRAMPTTLSNYRPMVAEIRRSKQVKRPASDRCLISFTRLDHWLRSRSLAAAEFPQA